MLASKGSAISKTFNAFVYGSFALNILMAASF